MKRIVFLGNSVAGVAAIEEIRKFDQASPITIISENADLPTQRHLFGSWLAKEIKEEDVLYRPADYYKANNITLLFGKNIVRVDFKKNRVIMEDKESIDFDILVITDTLTTKFPDIKGIQKKGVFSTRRFNDIKEVNSSLALIETIVVQVSDLMGFLLACALRQRNKEVILVVPSDFLLSSVIDQGPAQVLTKLLDDNAVRIITGNSIAEILGDGDVKAVRLSSGKVLASQAVIFSQTKADFKLFVNSGLTLDAVPRQLTSAERNSQLLRGTSPCFPQNVKKEEARTVLTSSIKLLKESEGSAPNLEQEIVAGALAIRVNESFKTNLDHVYAVDEACVFSIDKYLCDFEISAGYLAEQGRVVGRSILGEVCSYSVIPRFISLNIFDTSVVLLGMTKNQSELREYKEFDPRQNMYKKILMENDLVVGAILINVKDEGQKIKRLIEEKVTVTPDEFSEAKFPVNL